MLVVIEGMDRTGKSTLAAQLADEYHLENLHFDKPSQHPLAEYLRPVEAGPRRAVFDRYHVGERVWPRVFGRKSEYDDAMHLHVDLTLKSRGAVMVRPLRHWQSKEEMYRVLEDEPIDYLQWLDAEDMFIEEYRTSRLEVFAWCLCHDTPEKRGKIVHRAGQLGYEARKLADITPRWIGSTTPDLVLVGEQVGPGGKGEWILPFVPFRGTSGHFLMSELALLPQQVQARTAIVNAYDPTGRLEPIPQLLARFSQHRVGTYPRQPRVVALGKKADKELTAQGVEHGSVPHPQYVRRFQRAKGPGWYGKEILKEALGNGLQ